MKKIKSYLILAFLVSIFPLTVFANDVYFYHTDNFGTPLVMTNINGEVVWRSDELPFGEEYETIENPIKNNRRYLGKELDEESGLIYLGSRFLDPGTGRMNRPDPVGLVDPATGKINMEMLLNPQRQNRYIYGLNNPYKYVDPDGEFAFLGAALVGAAVAYFSHPDVANAPANSSTPTYESHGVRNIVIGAVGGAGVRGVGSVLAASNGIPSRVTDTLSNIEKTGQAPAGYKGGRIFKNDGRGGGQQLPQNTSTGNAISYKEYDVNPYQKGVNRGAERIVKGSNGKSYYTKDHYKSFKPIKK